MENSVIMIPFDELFRRRYELSYPGEQIENKIKFAMDFFKENESELVNIVENKICSNAASLLEHAKAGYDGHLGDSPCFYVQVASCDLNKIAKAYSIEELAKLLTLSQYYGFYQCDKKSRELGRVVKQYNIIDLKDFSWTNFNIKFFRALGKSSHLNAQLYPQLIEKYIFINAPALCRRGIQLVNKFQSKRAVKKQAVCRGKGSKCPFLEKFQNNYRLPLQ